MDRRIRITLYGGSVYEGGLDVFGIDLGNNEGYMYRCLGFDDLILDNKFYLSLDDGVEVLISISDVKSIEFIKETIE